MSRRRPLVPNANSPELLTKLLAMVGRGVRTLSTLQQVLGIEARTVQYYIHAGEWLGFLIPDDLSLSPLGLEFVYAGPDQPAVYARAVWQTPLAASLLRLGQGSMPGVDEIAGAIAAHDPLLAPATIRRRASAVRSLLAPAVGYDAATKSPDQQQLSLPLAVPLQGPSVPTLEVRATGTAYNPDIYRYLFSALLDHGELTLGQLRGLLDNAGAHKAPIGGYIDLALQRGDAIRVDESLVITAEACTYSSLSETTTSIILSDPGYRQYLSLLLIPSPSRAAQIQQEQLEPQYNAWNRRLFGHLPKQTEVASALNQVLLGRSLETFPIRTPVPQGPLDHAQPFLDCWSSGADLILALPPSLILVQGGLAAVNQALKTRGHATGSPNLATVPAHVHGGLFYPRERIPRSVPDTRTLRMRLLRCTPYVSMLGALLLTMRTDPGQLRLQRRESGWCLARGTKVLGPVLDQLDRFARERGWAVSRRPLSGLDAGSLLTLLDAVSIVSLGPTSATLAERCFRSLREEVEESELHPELLRLGQAIASALRTP